MMRVWFVEELRENLLSPRVKFNEMSQYAHSHATTHHSDQLGMDQRVSYGFTTFTRIRRNQDPYGLKQCIGIKLFMNAK